MREKIHPPYHAQVTVTCACGHSFKVGSTRDPIHVEVCSNCHPYYTGKHKLVDVAGRVDQFKQRLAKAKLREQSNKSVSKKKPKQTKKKDNSVKLG